MDLKKRFFFILLVLCFGLSSSELPSPYNNVNLMPYKPDGWYGNRQYIEELVLKFDVKTIVEVGSWMGLSTLHMAQIVPEDGKVYAVDTWEGSPNEYHHPSILSTLYDQFLSNVIHANLTHKIIPVRMDSLDAAAILDVSPDLIYIDATHTYEACYLDLQAWFPYVKDKGVLCGDDWAWGDGGVGRAVTQFAHENNLKVHSTGWFWWLERQ